LLGDDIHQHVVCTTGGHARRALGVRLRKRDFVDAHLRLRVQAV